MHAKFSIHPSPKQQLLPPSIYAIPHSSAVAVAYTRVTMDEDEQSSDEDSGAMPVLGNQTLSMLKRNDPKLTSLYIDGEDLGEELAAAGYLISNHTHLKSLYVERINEISPDTAAFFNGIGRNTSIVYLSISECEECNEIFTSPFFANNSNLRHLIVSNCYTTRNNTRSFAAGLSNCRESSLDTLEYKLNGDSDDEGDAELIEALNDKLCLTKLSLQKENPSEVVCYNRRCGALLRLLQNPNSVLETLDLSNYSISDECASVLVGLGGSKRLRHLILAGIATLTSGGWDELSKMLCNPNSSLEVLNIGRGNICNDGVLAFGRALTQNKSLKVLDLSGCSNVTPEGWLNFFAALRQGFVLEELNLDENEITDRVVASIIDLLTNGECKLVSLKLGHVESLFDTISGQGRNNLALGMANPEFRLRELCLNDCNINDDTAIEFANALQHDTSLDILRLDGNSITARGWAALSKVLCDTSTLNATVSSNHTLREVYQPDWDNANANDDGVPPMDLVSRLWMNSNPNKNEVSRLKILKYHFMDETHNIDITPFVDMEFGVLPFAIAWVGKDDEGFDLLHKLLRGMPSLFEFQGKTAHVSLVDDSADLPHKRKR